MNQQNDDHWLVRPGTIRKLWIGGCAILGLTVIAQIFIPIKGYFGADDWFAFGAVYGFICCLLMVVFAKLLGFVLKRGEDFYNPGGPLDGSDREKREQGHD
jgi:Na+/melibiose symporter-like transporter